MAYPVLTGTILIEANGAALNNAGQDEGIRADNAVVVKQIRIGRLRYPYVSGQAWRRWWREVLYTDFDWVPSEVTRETKSAYTKGDPIIYEEDDLFGYMAARKKATFRRISPLKNSLLISVLPNVIERDFGHFSRNLPPEADIIPFETEHYTTYLQGTFTLSLSDVGLFEVGEKFDLSEEMLKTYKDELEQVDERTYKLPLNKRIKRVQDVLKALARLRGGANLARNLSDVTPVVVLVGFLDGGNAPLQRLFEPDQNNERVLLNLLRLRSVVEDYMDRMLVNNGGKALYFGYRPSILTNEDEVVKAFEEDSLFKNCIEVAGTPQQALEKAAEQVISVFENCKL
ncbi:MAG: type I-B CRISPR-associated protein Cas7/Cst2/DevR [Thermosediminibacteraceae bacterium]|nr:type I-B CRISPR-associated protein Cas7/Cst2/DevR [Thermosediminibacteraceae bacterium]